MKPRTLLALVVIGILAIAGGWYFGTARQPSEQQAYNGGKLMFPDLAPKLQDVVRLTTFNRTLVTQSCEREPVLGRMVDPCLVELD